MSRYILMIVGVLVSVVSLAEPEPRSHSHPHQGILTAYTEAPQGIALSEKDQAKLQDFKPVYKKWKIGKRRRGVAIFRVAASRQAIWSVIRDFTHYPQWINSLKSTEIYHSQTQQDTSHLYVRFDASHWLLGKTTWYVHHQYPAAHLSEAELGQHNWGSWTLDYQHRSDFNDSVGFWQVLPVEGAPERHDVIYSVDLSLKNAPVFIRNGAIKKGLKTATQWVRKQAEGRKAPTE